MSAQNEEIFLEGVIDSPARESAGGGKDFLGAILECEHEHWVLTYQENSPFRPFHGRKVALSGKPFTPKGQHLIGSRSRPLHHLELSSMRLTAITPDVQLLEVGRHEQLRGRFKRVRCRPVFWRTALWFVTQQGQEFLVANNPERAKLGDVEVSASAYHVQLARNKDASSTHYIWITCIYD
jgi:hypothetical protein